MSNYPPELIKAFEKCKKDDWSEKAYKKYRKHAEAFLKSKSEDRIEQSKLVLELSRLSMKDELAELDRLEKESKNTTKLTKIKQDKIKNSKDGHIKYLESVLAEKGKLGLAEKLEEHLLKTTPKAS